MQIKRQKVRMHRRRRDEFERKASLIILFPQGTRKHDRSTMRLLSKRSPVVRYCTEVALLSDILRLDLTLRSCAFHQAATAAITSSQSEVGKSATAILTT
jgi:hypothetical protein